MTLQDMSKTTKDAADLALPARRREPSDRRPKKTEAERRRLEALTELVRDARANGDALTGPSGLLKDLTKLVLEISLEEEMTEHLGRGKHEPVVAGDTGEDPAIDADGKLSNRLQRARRSA